MAKWVDPDSAVGQILSDAMQAIAATDPVKVSLHTGTGDQVAVFWPPRFIVRGVDVADLQVGEVFLLRLVSVQNHRQYRDTTVTFEPAEPGVSWGQAEEEITASLDEELALARADALRIKAGNRHDGDGTVLADVFERMSRRIQSQRDIDDLIKVLTDVSRVAGDYTEAAQYLLDRGYRKVIPDG